MNGAIFDIALALVMILPLVFAALMWRLMR